jgi:DNA-directed RNA polymerase sigma subunit (sigma70/sigma32)
MTNNYEDLWQLIKNGIHQWDSAIDLPEFNNERLQIAISTLQPRLQDVLRLRFEQGLSLEDTGSRLMNMHSKQIGVTKERVRQMQSKALRMMRHPTRLNIIKIDH